MNTPAHVIFALAAFARPGDRPRNIAAALGGVAPDLSLYLMTGAAFAMGFTPREVFDRLYFSQLWQSVFAVDNSLVLWGGLLVLCLWRRWQAGAVFAGAAMLHLLFDFALHHDDARPHFWPLSDWVFVSPVSYWDKSHYGGVVGPVETGLVLALSAWLLWRLKGAWARAGIALLVLCQMAPLVMWGLMLGAG
ncbi:cobalamin biosynthesis protein CobQ [Roseovarius sp. C7]|uniref:cobalamin biosynthesis protein CobQ n=1 Tax=Roseovarius sp. C7 TaxID=3398643 RepID=UPI0039F74183